MKFWSKWYSNERVQILVRSSLAIIFGYIISALITILGTNKLPFSNIENVYLMTLLSFMAYTVLILFCFTIKNLQRLIIYTIGASSLLLISITFSLELI